MPEWAKAVSVADAGAAAVHARRQRAAASDPRSIATGYPKPRTATNHERATRPFFRYTFVVSVEKGREAFRIVECLAARRKIPRDGRIYRAIAPYSSTVAGAVVSSQRLIRNAVHFETRGG